MEEAFLQDRRIARTRGSIMRAFVALLGECRYDAIRVADVTERANVGRSTFYQHFGGKEDLLHQSMQPVLAMIADAAEANGTGRIRFAVAHSWENRRLGRILLSQPLLPAIRRALADLIEERIRRAATTAEADEMIRAQAIQIAASQLALIEAWTRGELRATQDQVVDRLCIAARM